MKMKRQEPSCLAVVLALLCLFAAGVQAEGEWNYVLKTDGTARVTGYTGGGTAPSVPARIDGFRVTEAGGKGFADPSSLTLPAGAVLTGAKPAQDGVTGEGLLYARHEETHAIEILGYAGSDQRVNVPRMIDGWPVTRIAADAFANNWVVSHVLLPDTMLEVGDRAFMNCKRLEQIHFNRDLLVIGEYAFCGCDALETAVLPKSLTCIGAYAFAYTPLNRVSIPDSVLVIGESAFDRNPKLGYARIGEGVRVIGRYAFAEAPLRRVKLPESVVRIGVGAFANTSYLSAEDAALKASLPEMGLTNADLTTRNWQGGSADDDSIAVEIDDFDLTVDEQETQTEVPEIRVTLEPAATPEPSKTPESAVTPEPSETPDTAEKQASIEAVEPSAQQESRQDAAGPVVRITARDRAKLRSAPGKSNGVLLRYAQQGEEFPFVRRAGGWYGLKLEDGTTAYVSSRMAELVGEESTSR